MGLSGTSCRGTEEVKMAGLFISYRRSDAEGWAGRLLDSLKANLGQVNIFRDIDDIPPGVDFDAYITEAVGSCSALIALIGPHWLTVTDKGGRRRLDNPADFTRLEIATALKRNVRVIPALVDNAEMPSIDELPEELKLLSRRQAYELTDARWADDCRRLANVLMPIVKPTRRFGPKAMVVLGLVVVLALGGLIVMQWRAHNIEISRIEEAAQEKATAEKAAREQAVAEKAARDRAAAEKAAQKQAAAEKAARERAAAEKAARDRAAAARGPQVKVSSANCVDLGSGRFRVELSGEAYAPPADAYFLYTEVMSKSSGGVRVHPMCERWSPAQSGDGTIWYVSCIHRPNDSALTKWKMTKVVAFNDGQPPPSGFALLFKPGTKVGAAAEFNLTCKGPIGAGSAN